jgi:hypothetical protein
MAAKGIVLGELTANGTLSLDATSIFGGRYGVLLTGSIGAGNVTVKGGDGTNQEVVQVIDPTDGSGSPIATWTTVGLFLIDALCRKLDFVLAGSTTPTLTIVVFPEGRP